MVTAALQGTPCLAAKCFRCLYTRTNVTAGSSRHLLPSTGKLRTERVNEMPTKITIAENVPRDFSRTYPYVVSKLHQPNKYLSIDQICTRQSHCNILKTSSVEHILNSVQSVNVHVTERCSYHTRADADGLGLSPPAGGGGDCSSALLPGYGVRQYSSKQRGPTELVYRHAAQHAQDVAISDVEGDHTYGHLLSWSVSVLERLQATLAVGEQHQRVALLLPAAASYTAALWAVWMAGHVGVPLCPQHPPKQLEYFLRDSGASAVLTCPALQHLLPETPSLQTVLVPPSSCISSAPPAPATTLRPSFGLASSSRPALIMYTSGTTGHPKGVVVSHGNLQHQVGCVARAWQYAAEDVVLHCLPLHHTHGVVNALLAPLAVGARVVMTHFQPSHIWSLLLGASTSLSAASSSLSAASTSLSAASSSLSTASTSLSASRTASSSAGLDDRFVLDQPEGSHVTLFMAVPTMYAKLLEYHDKRIAGSDHKRAFLKATCLQNVRLMISGSAALPESLLERWVVCTGHTLLERYGMTEIGMALTNPLHGNRRTGYVGRPFPGVSVRIVSDDPAATVLCEATDTHISVAPDQEQQEGELQVRGPNVFKEYWQKPEATQKEFTADGWFKTGDTAVLHTFSDGGAVGGEDAAIKILGRTSVDIIKSGGFKVSALAVERVMLEHSMVADVAVLGAPDYVWGQKICAVLVWKDCAPFVADQMKLWLKERLPSYQVPVQYITLTLLPRNNMGKVNKKQLLKDIFPAAITV